MNHRVLRKVSQNANFWVSWVPAAPFRAWLDHLAAATGFAPEAIAVAAGITPSTGRALQQRSYRIRSSDARGLLSLDTEQLLRSGATMTDTSLAHQALADLGPLCPGSVQLARELGVSIHLADGLIDGWLPTCRRSVVWHCLALAQSIARDETMVV